MSPADSSSNCDNLEQRCVKYFRRVLKAEFFSGYPIYFVLYQLDKI
ncbi:hypothetical protein EZS27_037863, partial [termite gut metagenome]